MEDWKVANVMPVFLKSIWGGGGWGLRAGNSKPVSLTSVLGKLVESVIQARITKHTEKLSFEEELV